MAAKKMTIEEVRGRDTAELRFDLQETRKALFHRRFEPEGESKDNSSIRELRRSVARILTVLQEREAAVTAASSEQN